MSSNIGALQSPYDELIHRSARQWGLDPLLIKAVIQQESGFDRDAASPDGAQGLMQIMPQTGRAPGYGVKGFDSDLAAFDPDKAIPFGTEYLRKMIDRYGDVPTALAAYNAGPGFVDQWLEQGADPAQLPEETRAYIDRIRDTYTGAKSAAEQPEVPRETSAQQRAKALAEELSRSLRTRELLESKPAGFDRLSDEVEFVTKSLAAGALDTLSTLGLAHSFMPGMDGYKIAADRAEDLADSLRQSIPEWMRPAIDEQIIERDEDGNPTGFNIPSLRKIASLVLESAGPSGVIIGAGRALGKQIMKKAPQFAARHGKFVTASSLATANSLYLGTDTYGEVYDKVLEKALEEGASRAEAEQEASMAGAVAASRIMPVAFITGFGGEGLAATGKTGTQRLIRGLLGGSTTESVEEGYQYLAEQYGLKEPAELADFLERGVLGAFGAGPVEGTLAAITGDPNAGRPPSAAAEGYKTMDLSVRESVNELVRGMTSKLTPPPMRGRPPQAARKAPVDLPPPATPAKAAEAPQPPLQELPEAPAAAPPTPEPNEINRQVVHATPQEQHVRLEFAGTKQTRRFKDRLLDAKGKQQGSIVYTVAPETNAVQVKAFQTQKGQGIGLRLYERFLQDWMSEGYTVYSDAAVSREAQNVYESLSRRGYAVERSPNAERGSDGVLAMKKSAMGLKVAPFDQAGEPEAVFRIRPAGEAQPGQGTLSLPPGPDTEGQRVLGESELTSLEPQREAAGPRLNRGGKFMPRPEPVEEAPVEQDFTRDERGRIVPRLPLKMPEETAAARRGETAGRQREAAAEAEPGQQVGLQIEEPFQVAPVQAELERIQSTPYGKRTYGGFRLYRPEEHNYATRAEAAKEMKPPGSKILRLNDRYYIVEPVMDEAPAPAEEARTERVELEEGLWLEAPTTAIGRQQAQRSSTPGPAVTRQSEATPERAPREGARQPAVPPAPAPRPEVPLDEDFARVEQEEQYDRLRREPAIERARRAQAEPQVEGEPETVREYTTPFDQAPASDNTARAPHQEGMEASEEEFARLAEEAVEAIPVPDVETSAGSGQAASTPSERKVTRREAAKRQRELEESVEEILGRHRSVHWTALWQRLWPSKSFARQQAAKEFKFLGKLPITELFKRVFKSYFMLLRMYVQDSFIPVRYVQEILTGHGVEITDATNFYRMHELMQSTTDAKWIKIQRQTFDPIAQRMQQLGVTQEELDNYLWWTHAPWRNAFLKRRRQEAGQPEPDSGLHIYAGIKSEEARTRRAELVAGREDAFRELDAMIRPVSQNLRGLYREYGLVPDALLDVWDGTAGFALDFDAEGNPVRPEGMSAQAFDEAMFFATYVPLRDFRPERFLRQLHRMMGADEHMNPAVDVFGDEVREALGRTSEPAAQLANLQAMTYMALIRGERNKAIGALYDLAKENPVRSLWWTGELESSTDVIDEKTGLPTVVEEVLGEPVEGVQYRQALGIPSIVPGDNRGTDAQRRGVGTFRFKRDGKTYAVQTYWAPMTDAIKGSERLPKSMMAIRSLAAFNRWIAVANTTLSPGFAVTNLVRDYFTAKQLLREEQFEPFRKGVTFENWRKAMKAYYGELKNRPEPNEQADPEAYKWRQIVKRYREAGAHTAFFQMKTPLDHYRALERIAKGKRADLSDIGHGLVGIYNWMNDANTTIENAIRLVAFAAATDPNINPKPMTDAQAASLAKNLTVNFQKRGHASIWLGGLYVFFNASMQGNVRLLGALGRSKKVRGVTGAIAAGGFVNALMNEALGGDDDSGRSYFSQVPEHVRTRNMVFMIPDSGGRYIAIPLPYGFNVFWTTGSAMGLMANSDNFEKGPDRFKFLLEPLTTAASTFSPISSSTFARAILPTAAEPAYDLWNNRNFFGSPINPEKNPYADFVLPDAFNVLNPDDQKVFQAVAQTLGRLTGGTPAKKGLIDVSPGTLRYLLDYFGGTGIAGSTMFRTMDAAQALFLEEDIEKAARKTPIVRRLYGMVPEFQSRERYYQLKEYLKGVEAQREYMLSIRREEPGLYEEFMTDHQIFWSTGIMRRLDATERSLGRLYTRRNKLRARAGKNEAQLRMLKNYNDQINRLTSQFNESYFDFIVRGDTRYTGL